MKNIAVIFGGKSVEHDISIITGLQTINNLNKDYNVIPIYITRDGEWWTGDRLILSDSYINFSTTGLNKCWLIPHSNKLNIKCIFKVKQKKIDNIILALHGINGEDGSVQGLLQLCEIPFSSSGIMGSALTMDKVLCKQILKQNNIDTPDFIYFYISEWQQNSKKILQQIKEKFNNNVIIKPARSGSSIGITRCENAKDIKSAIELAQCFDNKIIVEQTVNNFREINISCMGIENDIHCSCLEEVVHKNTEILGFDQKYLNNDNTSRIVDIDLPTEIKERIIIMAQKAFLVCDCTGVVRLDFLVEDKQIWLNEINSIPGSMANYLWKDMTFSKLLDKLIEISNRKLEEKQKLTYSYNSEALINFNNISNTKFMK